MGGVSEETQSHTLWVKLSSPEGEGGEPEATQSHTLLVKLSSRRSGMQSLDGLPKRIERFLDFPKMLPHTLVLICPPWCAKSRRPASKRTGLAP